MEREGEVKGGGVRSKLLEVKRGSAHPRRLTQPDPPEYRPGHLQPVVFIFTGRRNKHEE
ncbi:hypothetical protein FQA47_004780 [Oryzias melastigma]|uniref:Uncharacterized protein n=1 Tax=Oryzias melastigma TaxID=30732 RepID=A0A834CMX9_ORYME|nr:hypothetical protein FQA47_004780 [Oryzias melastigma]